MGRVLLVPDAGVLDAEFIEPGYPGGQLIATGYAEGAMVQACVALIEAFSPIALVLVQPNQYT